MSPVSVFFNKFIYLFIYLFVAVLGLHFCARAFSSCSERGTLIAVRGPHTIAASLVAEHRLQTRRLSSCGSRAQLLRGMWDLPRPGLKPVCPALAGRFSTTVPPGKPLYPSFSVVKTGCIYWGHIYRSDHSGLSRFGKSGKHSWIFEGGSNRAAGDPSCFQGSSESKTIGFLVCLFNLIKFFKILLWIFLQDITTTTTTIIIIAANAYLTFLYPLLYAMHCSKCFCSFNVYNNLMSRTGTRGGAREASGEQNLRDTDSGTHKCTSAP